MNILFIESDPIYSHNIEQQAKIISDYFTLAYLSDVPGFSFLLNSNSEVKKCKKGSPKVYEADIPAWDKEIKQNHQYFIMEYTAVLKKFLKNPSYIKK